ncbi:hypothetical protein, partial [Leptospira noguchii]|uniref:hypothetical protein n=1 Tax=Leptospira noguchii TaxID=28182 RepID=UPI0005695CAE
EGYINSGEFHGHYRILNSSLHDAVVKERYEYNLQKQITKYTSLSSTNILESPNQSTGSAPYERTGDSLNNQSTNQTNNKEKIQSFSLSEITWLNISEHSKNRILKEWGEYDHNPEKENVKIKSWKNLIPENPEVVLETLRKLIQIRKSEKYKEDGFWGTIPVNIASTYSYKDIIKNTYNLLTQVGSKTLSIKENKEEIRNGSKINNRTKNENEPTWEGFLVWAKERLSKSSIQSLKQLRVQFENEELSIVGEINDSLKMIVIKYFKEVAKLKTEVKFVKEEETQEKEKNFNSSKKSDQKSNEENQTHITELNEEISIPVDQSDFKHFRDYMSVDKVIHEFMSHSTLTLDRKDLEIIRNLKIRYDLEKIVIFDSPPERLKNHIRDYFYRHPQRVIALQFEENKFYVAA